MTTKLEIERKWLVLSGSDVIEDYKWNDLLFIDQWYLEPINEPGTWFRLRKIYHNSTGKYSFWYCTKELTDIPGISKETEREITGQEFKEIIENEEEYNLTGWLSKTRKVFEYQNHVFEFDDIDLKTGNIYILECELTDINEPLELPPELVLQEITHDRSLCNRSLAARNIQ